MHDDDDYKVLYQNYKVLYQNCKFMVPGQGFRPWCRTIQPFSMYLIIEDHLLPYFKKKLNAWLYVHNNKTLYLN